MRRNKVYFNASGSDASSISLKNPDRVRGKRKQMEKMRSGQKGNRRFEGEGGAGMLHYQRRDRWARLNSGDKQPGVVLGRSHSVGECEISKRSREGSSRSGSFQGL